MVLLLLAAMLAPQLQGQFADSERLAAYLTTAANPATPQAKTPSKK